MGRPMMEAGIEETGRAVEALACFCRSSEKILLLFFLPLSLSNWSFPCYLIYISLVVVEGLFSLDVEDSGYFRINELLVSLLSTLIPDIRVKNNGGSLDKSGRNSEGHFLVKTFGYEQNKASSTM